MKMEKPHANINLNAVWNFLDLKLRLNEKLNAGLHVMAILMESFQKKYSTFNSRGSSQNLRIRAEL